MRHIFAKFGIYLHCVWSLWSKVQASGTHVEEFAKLIVSAAVRGDANVKFPSWYDVFLLYRVFAPDVLSWTFRLLLSPQGMRATSFIGTGKPASETPSPPRRPLSGAPQTASYTSSPRIQLVEWTREVGSMQYFQFAFCVNMF